MKEKHEIILKGSVDMDNMSNKAKVIYAAFKEMGAVDKESKVTSYAILDYIVEEAETLQENELLKDIPDQEYVDITLDVNIKSINAIVTSLAKKDLVVKTEPSTITVDGTSRSLRQYFLKQK
jgi:uncharacterized protein (UPF0276 family)